MINLNFIEIRNIKLKDVINTPDNSDIGYFIEVDLSYPHKIIEKNKNITLLPKIR